MNVSFTMASFSKQYHLLLSQHRQERLEVKSITVDILLRITFQLTPELVEADIVMKESLASLGIVCVVRIHRFVLINLSVPCLVLASYIPATLLVS